METKFVRVPFEVELAKEITNGVKEGRIKCGNGDCARIICWDSKIEINYPILALVENGAFEHITSHDVNGNYNNAPSNEIAKLVIEIPEYMTFKDGDVIIFGASRDNLLIGIFKEGDKNGHKDYIALGTSGFFFEEEGNLWVYDNARFATEEEKQKLIDALKHSDDPRAKDCLKKLGILEDPKCNLKPFDRVVVRDDNDVWCADIFSHKNRDGKYVCIGCTWKYCIPYNEETEHLVGTFDYFE